MYLSPKRKAAKKRRQRRLTIITVILAAVLILSVILIVKSCSGSDVLKDISLHILSLLIYNYCSKRWFYEII